MQLICTKILFTFRFIHFCFLWTSYFLYRALNVSGDCIQAERFLILHMLCREGNYQDVSFVCGISHNEHLYILNLVLY